MTTTETILYFTFTFLAMVLSFICSGMETGSYTLNRIRLHVLTHQQDRRAVLLSNIIHQPAKLLGALLIGNNLAHFLMAYSVGAMLMGLGYEDSRQVLINTLILTPLTFIFCEVLPKDLFRAHADTLAYNFARFLRGLQIILTWTGLQPLVDSVAYIIKLLVKSKANPYASHRPRGQIGHLMKESVGHGLLSNYQSDMVDRVLRLDDQVVADVMTPWAKATTLVESQSPEVVWQIANHLPFSRLPLTDAAGKPVGILNVYDVLIHPHGHCPPLRTLIQPPHFISPDMSLRQCLVYLQRNHTPMAIVIRNDKPVGLVTTKNLVEPIVGQLETW